MLEYQAKLGFFFHRRLEDQIGKEPPAHTHEVLGGALLVSYREDLDPFMQAGCSEEPGLNVSGKAHLSGLEDNQADSSAFILNSLDGLAHFLLNRVEPEQLLSAPFLRCNP